MNKQNLTLGLALVALVIALVSLAKPVPTVNPPLGQITDINYFDRFYAATSTRANLGEFLADGSGTTTAMLSTSVTGVGSCIQLKDSTTTDAYRLYIGLGSATGGAGHGLVVEKGVCK